MDGGNDSRVRACVSNFYEPHWYRMVGKNNNSNNNNRTRGNNKHIRARTQRARVIVNPPGRNRTQLARARDT